MKKILLFCLIFSFCAQAQKINVTKSSDFPSGRGLFTYQALDHDSSGFYYVRDKGGYSSSKYVIQKFDFKKSSFIFEKTIDLAGDAYIGGGARFLEAFNKNNRILLFTHASKGKENHLMMQKFSSFTGEEASKPVIIDELKDTKLAFISDATLDFKITFSPDNKKMLVVSEYKKDEKVQNVKARLYDAVTFEKIWEKEPIKIYENSTVSSFDYHIDNEGTFFYMFVYLRNDDKKTYWNGTITLIHENYVHGIGIINANSTENKIIAIPSTGITTLEPRLELIKDKLICTGQYFEGEHVVRTLQEINNTGFFLLTIDPAKAELKTKSFVFFNEEIRANLAYKDIRKKYSGAGNKEYSNFETFLYNNCFYHVIERVIDKGYVTSFGKEIIIYKYDQNHKLEWMKLIQRNTLNELNGLFFLVTKKINLFYYDSPDNLQAFPEAGQYDSKKYELVKDVKSSVMVCASIDDKGSISRQQISTDGEFLLLDGRNHLNNRVPESNSIIVPVYLTSSMLRFNMISLEE